jgi:integrase
MLRKDIKKRPLSEKTLKSLTPEDKDYRELDGFGLYLLVKKSGVKNWQYRYKNHEGKWAWMGLGAYPQVSAQLARKKVQEYNLALSKGETLKPKKVLLEERKEIESFYFKNLMKDWLDTKSSKWGEATYTKAEKSIHKHLMPVFGKRNFKGISAKEWFDFFQKLQRTLGIHTQIEKLVSYVRSCYDWAKFQGKIDSNPLEGMSKHLDKYESGNMNFIQLEEVPQLLRKIRSNQKRAIGIGLELLIMLFPRPGELRCAKWEQFDLDKALWTKPAEMTKTRQEHQVPLPRQAIALLNQLKVIQPDSKFLFPSRLSVNKTISDMTFNLALNRLGYQGKQNPHGFRHLVSTTMNDRFSDKEQVIEVCLAHKKKGVKGVYDKSQHLDERRILMQWWADYLTKSAL